MSVCVRYYVRVRVCIIVYVRGCACLRSGWWGGGGGGGNGHTLYYNPIGLRQLGIRPRFRYSK